MPADAISDGCSAGPLSGVLNDLIGACCVQHDALGELADTPAAWIEAGAVFFECVAGLGGPEWTVLAALVTVAVIGTPVGWSVWWFGRRRRQQEKARKNG
jgi:hypothetical protein